jgi:hypothetical protein
MPGIQISSIVEGHGEVAALPVLLRRLGQALAPGSALHVGRPIRRSKDKLLPPGVFEADIELAANQLTAPGAIVVVIDSDGECPAELGRHLSERARNARPDCRFIITVAHREFESWFLAAASSLAGKRGLSADLMDHPQPESVQGAKEWLRDRMPSNRRVSTFLCKWFPRE